MMKSKPVQMFSCHIKYLPCSLTKSEVAVIFSNYDDLLQIFISEKKSEQTYKYGFVRFRSWASAKHAVKNVTGKMVKGQKLLVSHARSTILTDSVSADLLVNNVRKQLQEEFDSKDEEIDKLLVDVTSKRWLKLHHSGPECAFSLELTDILTDTMDYKYWNEFFSNQKEISRKLKMIQPKSASNGSR